MLLDDFMPQFQFAERHWTTLPAAREDVYHALQQVDFGRSRVIRVLFALRGLGRWFRHGSGCGFGSMTSSRPALCCWPSALTTRS